MAVRRYMEKKWGVRTRLVENPVRKKVGTEPVVILRNNPDRFHWFVMNLSPNEVYLAYDERVSSTRGALLGAKGGFAVVSADVEGEVVTWEVWAVATAADRDIYVVVTEAI